MNLINILNHASNIQYCISEYRNLNHDIVLERIFLDRPRMYEIIYWFRLDYICLKCKNKFYIDSYDSKLYLENKFLSCEEVIIKEIIE